MLEIKVGALVVTGLTLLVIFVFAIGDLSALFRPGYAVRVMFESANGITGGSPVQYAGVEVGKVQGVRIVNDPEGHRPQVEVLVRLPSYVQVYTDDIAAISTFGLLGEKYLEVTPGPGEGERLKPGGRLVGKPPVSTEDIIERSNQVLTEFQQTLQGLNDIVGSPESRIYLKEALQEARDATRNWKILGERLNLTLSYAESGEGSLGKLLYHDDLYLRMEAFVEDIQANPWKLLFRPKRQKRKSAGTTPPEIPGDIEE